MTEFVSITRAEVVELCERLGHDSAKVARIVIDPHNVTVEYLHPITDMAPAPRSTRHGIDEQG